MKFLNYKNNDYTKLFLGISAKEGLFGSIFFLFLLNIIAVKLSYKYDGLWLNLKFNFKME